MTDFIQYLKNLKENPNIIQFKTTNPTANVIVVVIAIIAFWRGIWGLLDLLLFPNLPFLSYIVSILLGALILYLDGFSLKDLKR